jgi:hypothetical protein
MRGAYRVLASLIAIGVLVQAAAIAFGWFDVLSAEETVINDDWEDFPVGLAIHGIVGLMVMPLLGLLLFIVSFFTRSTVVGSVKWGGLTFLAIVVQVLLAFVAFGAAVVGVLHGVNAFVVLGLALMANRAATAPVATPTAPATPTTV